VCDVTRFVCESHPATEARTAYWQHGGELGQSSEEAARRKGYTMALCAACDHGVNASVWLPFGARPEVKARGMRRCEACSGPGPALWADGGPNSGRYCCQRCHPCPGDTFFTRPR
jgi:hypothetical protein